MSAGEQGQFENGDTSSSANEKSSETTKISPILGELLQRYHAAREAGATVDFDKLCQDYPEYEEEARSILEAMRAAESELKAIAPKETGATLEQELTDSTVTLAARFTQLRPHAQGGLGIVFRAYDEDLGREVAIKILAENQGVYYEECRRRFLRESEVMGRLRHPGIIPVLGRGETLEGRPFYVMPFLEEGSLEDAIRQFHEDHPVYSPNDSQFRDLLSRFMAACKTVAYAHSRGVVHRDLKPRNIMLGRYGETLVIDWGLAEKSRREDMHRLTGERSIELRGSTGTSSTSGGFTPQYASPEQFDGTVAIGPPSDIYSLGAILYKLVTGFPPLTATTFGDMRQAGLKGDFPPPRDRNRSTPRPLQAICLKAMKTDPAQRYKSPERLVADVEAFLADAPVSAHEEDVLSRSARLVRHNWPVFLAAMAGLLVITFFSFVTAYTQRGLKENARESSISRLQLAATLAAQACGAEIDRRWRLLELEAASPKLIDAVELLNTEKSNSEAREKLQALLTERYVDAHNVQGIKILSMFVNAIDGEQLARVPKSDSISENFAYRDYFHGQQMDLPKDAKPPPSKRPVLSVVFISTNTNQPQVAMSVPIRGQDEEGKEHEVIGRLAMTVTVGDLGMFEQLRDQEVPLLVESRNYNWDGSQSYGVVLHHPGFHTRQLEKAGQASLPRVATDSVDSFVREWKRNTLAPEGKSALQVSRFVDPIDDQETEAAFAKVLVPGRDSEVNDTGWFVVLHPRSSDGE